MGHITAELTKGWMMEGIGMQVILRNPIITGAGGDHWM